MADKMNTDYWNSFYTGIAPPRGAGAWGSNQPTWAAPASIGSPYMTSNERAQLEQQIAQSKALQATMGNAPKTVMASGPAWNEPTELDLAAIDKWNAGMSGSAPPPMTAYAPAQPAAPALTAATGLAGPVTSVTSAMKPTRGGGGLLQLLMGPSKNGLGGLAGLLGGSDQGGLLGLLNQRAAGPVTGDALVARATGATSSAENQAWREKTYGGDGKSLMA